eukprot:Hpha_TRINITY_DN1185_c0_g1::TRINITY_DN1185_c0_g1_i1::g.113052::m.113052
MEPDTPVITTCDVCGDDLEGAPGPVCEFCVAVGACEPEGARLRAAEAIGAPAPKRARSIGPQWARQRLLSQRLKDAPPPEEPLFDYLREDVDWAWILPLETLIATGHLELEVDRGSKQKGSRLTLFATRALFTNCWLPLENGLPLQALMNKLLGGQSMGDIPSQQACERAEHYPRGSKARDLAIRHDPRPAGDGWVLDPSIEPTIPPHLRPCRFCFAPCLMHYDLEGTLENTVLSRPTRPSPGRRHMSHNEVLEQLGRQARKARSPKMEFGEPSKVEGLQVCLRHYQLKAVEWWRQREENAGDVLVPSVRVEFPDADGECFYFNNLTSELSLRAPCGRHGGILASEMGMGKTVISAAAMVTCGFRDKDAPKWERGYPTGGSLVVVPPVLLRQWRREMRKLCPGVKVHVYDFDPSVEVQDLAEFDVVVASYEALQPPNRCTQHAGPAWMVASKPRVRFGELSNSPWGDPHSAIVETELRKCEGQSLTKNEFRASKLGSGLSPSEVEIEWFTLPLADSPEEYLKISPLLRVKWHRLVCDEAHTCEPYLPSLFRIVSRNRWMLSGTPFWNGSVCILNALYGSEVLDRYRSLTRTLEVSQIREYFDLSRLMLRHRKEDMYSNGQPLLQLPPKHEHDVAVNLSDKERCVYERIMQSYLKAGQVISLNEKIGTLRSLISDPSSISKHINPFRPNADWRLHVVSGGGPAWKKRKDHVLRDDEIQLRGCDVEYVTLTKLAELLKEVWGGRHAIVDSILKRDFMSLPEECPVCFETMQLGTRQHPLSGTCGHMICTACYKEGWAKAARAGEPRGCPMCRRPLWEGTVRAVKPVKERRAAGEEEEE